MLRGESFLYENALQWIKTTVPISFLEKNCIALQYTHSLVFYMYLYLSNYGGWLRGLVK